MPVASASFSAAPGGDEAREFKGILQYGRGLESHFGTSWIEGAAGFAHFTGGRGDELKLDLTAGLRPDENWIVMAQVFGTFGLRNAAFGATDFDAVRLKISVGRKVWGGRTLLIGLGRDIHTRRAEPGFEISASLWSSFTLDDLIGEDEGQDAQSPERKAPASARSMRSAVSETP
jgi:hypothetical protein